jgi:hypothetical protein
MMLDAMIGETLVVAGARFQVERVPEGRCSAVRGLKGGKFHFLYPIPINGGMP